MIFLALALLTQSCVMYTDRDEEENAKLESLAVLHEIPLNSVLQTVKVADFFDNYQKIREDRDAALSLGKEYYGGGLYEDYLFYERYHGGSAGRIDLTDEEGRYIVTPSFPNNKPEVRYYVEVEDGRRYRITTAPPTKDLPPFYFSDFSVTLDCIASVSEDGTIIIKYLDMSFIEVNGTQEVEATIRSTSDPVESSIKYDAEHIMIPTSGVLDYEITGFISSDKFSVSYYQGKFGIL